MMPNNPGRTLAAHVQAAIAKGQGVGVQPKVSEVAPGRQMAAHVQAAIARAQSAGLQPKMERSSNPQRPLAPHVQAAIARAQGVGLQPKIRAPLGGPSPHVRGPIAQAKAGPGHALQLAAAAPGPVEVELDHGIRHTIKFHLHEGDNLKRIHEIQEEKKPHQVEVRDRVAELDREAWKADKGIFNPSFLEKFGNNASVALKEIAQQVRTNPRTTHSRRTDESGHQILDLHLDFGEVTGWKVKVDKESEKRILRREYKQGVHVRFEEEPERLTLLTMFPTGDYRIMFPDGKSKPYRDDPQER